MNSINLEQLINSVENLVNTLLDMGWLKAVEDNEKPAVCVVKN